MAFTPAVPDFIGSVGNLKIRVWYSPSFDSGDTVTVPGLKQIFGVIGNGSTSGITITSSLAANGLGTVVTITGSSTNAAPFAVFGY